MKNIDTFLPVLEFRVARFAGTEGALRRINYHVVFSNDITSDQIEQQFLKVLALFTVGDVYVSLCKKALTLHLARGEGHERYFGCNLMQRKVLASSHQHLMTEAP